MHSYMNVKKSHISRDVWNSSQLLKITNFVSIYSIISRAATNDVLRNRVWVSHH